MNKIKILFPEWYSLQKLAEWVSDEFRVKGFDVIIERFTPNAVKHAQEPLLLITGGLKQYSFMRLCDFYNKKGTIWVDILEDKKPVGYATFQRGFRNKGGKFICTTTLEKDRLESGGVIIDAVIPRCVQDKVFDYMWQGKKKTVISVGNPDVRKEAIVFKWAHLPDEFKRASRKGHEYLVKFAVNNPDWKVNLVSHRDQLKKICDSIELSNLNILETGTVIEHDLFTAMANSGVYAHPCRVEPFGMVIVEAQAIGVPTCFTDLPQQNDIGGGIQIPFIDNYRFPSGVTLATIDYNEVEKGIYKTYAMAEELSKLGRDNAQRFRVSNIVNRLMEVM